MQIRHKIVLKSRLKIVIKHRLIESTKVKKSTVIFITKVSRLIQLCPHLGKSHALPSVFKANVNTFKKYFLTN